MTNRDDSEQLAWDFDAPESDGSSAAVVADEGLASLTPGSERWIAALQPTDADAMRLDKVDVASMSAEAAARLWARVAAWVESDQIAYYIDDAPVSSDAAYDARLRCLQSLERSSHHLTHRSHRPIAWAARSPTTSLPYVIHRA